MREFGNRTSGEGRGEGHERERRTRCTGAQTTRRFIEEFSIFSSTPQLYVDSPLARLALRSHEERLAAPVGLLRELVVGVHVEVIAKVNVGGLGHGPGAVDDALKLHVGGRGAGEPAASCTVTVFSSGVRTVMVEPSVPSFLPTRRTFLPMKRPMSSPFTRGDGAEVSILRVEGGGAHI